MKQCVLKPGELFTLYWLCDSLNSIYLVIHDVETYADVGAHRAQLLCLKRFKTVEWNYTTSGLARMWEQLLQKTKFK